MCIKQTFSITLNIQWFSYCFAHGTCNSDIKYHGILGTSGTPACYSSVEGTEKTTNKALCQ